MGRDGVPSVVSRWASGLRFPVLFGLIAIVFGVDLFVPDFIPFVDEILLGLGAGVLGSWKKRKGVTKVESAGQGDPGVGEGER